MPDHKAYYVVELNVLKPDKVYPQSIVVYDGQGNKTKFMSLNQNSIEVMIRFLQNEAKRIEQNKKAV